MNSICWILIQELALFTTDAIIEVAEFSIERDETYDPGLSAERTDGRGILLEIRERTTRTCFTPECFCRLLHTRGTKVMLELMLICTPSESIGLR